MNIKYISDIEAREIILKYGSKFISKDYCNNYISKYKLFNVGKTEIFDYLQKELLNNIGSFSLLSSAKGISNGLLSWERNLWNSELFDSNVASINFLYIEKNQTIIAHKLLDVFIDYLHFNKYSFAYIKVNKNSIWQSKVLNDKGFNKVETSLTFYHNLQNINTKKNIRIYQPANNDEILQVSEIAKNSFTFDRYHVDKNINNIIANKSREIWARNLCNGRAIKVLITKMDRRVTGFLGIIEKPILNYKYAVLDLIGIDVMHQGTGLGYALTTSFLKEAKERGNKFAIVKTQDKNEPSIKLYKKCGFEIIDKDNTHHFHL